MKQISIDLMKAALRLEEKESSVGLYTDISYQEIMVQEILGTNTAAYLAESTCNQPAVREIILAGVEVGRLLEKIRFQLENDSTPAG